MPRAVDARCLEELGSLRMLRGDRSCAIQRLGGMENTSTSPRLSREWDHGQRNVARVFGVVGVAAGAEDSWEKRKMQ